MEYKVIEGFGLDKFNEKLNRMIEENWSPSWGLNTTYTPSGTKYSILLMRTKPQGDE